eukprot:SAG22_NODE_133_length_18379_cov_34.571937_5_plen_220_part_00
MWRVPGSMYTGFTNRLVEMVDLMPTLIEIAGIEPLPQCGGDAPPSINCVQGQSYASAFGIGNSPVRTEVVHQWPYSIYLADACSSGTAGSSGNKRGHCASGVPPFKHPNPNCSTLAGNGLAGPKTATEARQRLLHCPKTMAYAIRDRRWRYIANMQYDGSSFAPDWSAGAIVSEQLYDYDTDLHETVNLAPNASFAPVIKRLRARLQERVVASNRPVFQ